MQAERRKKKFTCFLSRGAAYLGPKVKVSKPRGEKRSLLVFYPEAPLILDRRSKYLSDLQGIDGNCSGNVPYLNGVVAFLSGLVLEDNLLSFPTGKIPE